MHIAISVEGTRGDVAPMLFLASTYLERGHRVSFAGPPGFREQVERLGIRFAAASADVHAFMARHSLAIARGGLRAARAFDTFGREHCGVEFDASFAVARDADVMIAAGVQLGAASAAEAAGIPYRYVAYCPALLPSPEHPPFVLPFADSPPRVNRWLWRGFLPLFSWTLRRQVDRERRLRGLPPVGEVHEHFRTRRPVLASDAGLAGRPVDLDGVPYDTIGIPALQPLEGGPLPQKLESFLAQGPRPVYIGFGSMTDPDPGATTRMVVEAVERAGCRAVISAGWAGLGGAALPSTILAVGGVSHPTLFPRCALVVHHGGAGTTHTAARAGVPQVVVPHIGDQFFWASRARRQGVAPAGLSRRRLDADRLATALRAMLDNEHAAERAAELGRTLRAEYARAFDPEAILVG